MWAVEVCLINSYILYKTYCNQRKLKLKYSHYEFLCQIGKAWLHPEEYFERSKEDTSVASLSETTTTSFKGKEEKIKSSRSKL